VIDLEDDDSEEEDSDNEAPKKKLDLASTIDTDPKSGWQLIPARGDKSLDDSKGTIRAYVTATYRKPPSVRNSITVTNLD